MTLLKDPKNLLILLFIALLLSFILIIVRHHHSNTYHQQKIDAYPRDHQHHLTPTSLQFIAYFSS